jgi:glucokinase
VTDERPSWVLGLDIGGTKTAIVAGSVTGTVLERQAHPSEAGRGFAGMWESMTAAAGQLVARRGAPLAIGVSIGGPLDAERGIIYSPPNLPGWDAIPLKDRLVEHFGVPAFVEHDARAGALAEWMFGAARGATNVVYLTFGTGLGAGMILGGQLYRGASGDAGEVGHWRMGRSGPEAYGKTASWEAMASGAGLPKLARYRYPSEPWPDDLSAEILIRLAREGDARARDVLNESALSLGAGIAQLVDLLNPDIVVLGSLAVRAGAEFLPVVRDVVARECTPRTRRCPVVASELGVEAGDIAALCAAIHHGRLGERA